MPHSSEPFRSLPHDAANFRTVPHASEPFGRMPQGSESSETEVKSADGLPPADWRESYTLTVREATRFFEAAGVARSERSIVNWCQRNRQGIARLDAYFDPNERRYFITPQSVDAAIAEEKARAAKVNAEIPLPIPNDRGSGEYDDAEAFRTTRHEPESSNRDHAEVVELAELRKENIDLKITNRGKDYFIEQLQKEREGLIKQVVDSSQRVGQLESELRLLGESSDHNARV